MGGKFTSSSLRILLLATGLASPMASASSHILHRRAPDLRQSLAPFLEVIIDGENYPLPSTGSVPILRLNGDSIELRQSAIVNHGQTVSVPPVTAPTHIFVGLEDFVVQPSQSIPPAANVNDTFQQLEALATDVTTLFDRIQPDLDQFAANKIDFHDLLQDAELDLVVTLDVIAGELDKFTRTLEGLSAPRPEARDSAGFDLNNLPPHTVVAIANAYNATRQSMGVFRSLHSLFNVGPGLSGAIQSQLKDYLANDVSQLLTHSTFTDLTAFENEDWKTVLDQAFRGPGSPTAIEDDDDIPKLYFFSSKAGTPKDIFDTFCKDLDGGVGFLDSFDGVPWQGYQTNLKLGQVAFVKSQPWYAAIQLVPDLGWSKGEDSLFRHVPARERVHSNQNQEDKVPLDTRNIIQYFGKPRHLQLLSGQPSWGPIENQIASFDSSGGDGVTIYIVDAGFDKSAAELQGGANRRKIGEYIVPNTLTSPPNLLSNQMAGYTLLAEGLPGHLSPDHGTEVAVAAAGLESGVAPQASLNLLKAVGTLRRNSDGELFMAEWQYGAVHHALSVIVRDITAQKLFGKAVVNFSFGISSAHGQAVDDQSPLYDLWAKFEEWCRTNGVVFVAAAGNNGNLGTASIPSESFQAGEDERC